MGDFLAALAPLGGTPRRKIAARRLSHAKKFRVLAGLWAPWDTENRPVSFRFAFGGTVFESTGARSVRFEDAAYVRFEDELEIAGLRLAIALRVAVAADEERVRRRKGLGLKGLTLVGGEGR